MMNEKVVKIYSYLKMFLFEMKQSKFRLFSNSMSYYSLLAIVPLLVVAFALLKSFGVEAFLDDLLKEVLKPVGADSELVEKYLVEFINNSQDGIVGGIGAIFFLITTFSLLDRVSEALNHFWYVDHRRNIMTRATQYMGMIMFVLILAICSAGLNLLSHKEVLTLLYIDPDLVNSILPIISKGISIILTALVLALLYKTMPNTWVKFSAAFLGGLFCAVLWLPITWGFSHIIGASSKYSLIYGGFASVAIGIVWLNVVWMLFLLGAKVSFLCQYPNSINCESNRRLSPYDIEASSTQLIVYLKKCFSEQNDSVSIYQLMSVVNLDYEKTKKIIKPFVEQKIVHEVNQGSNCFMISMSPEKLTKELITDIAKKAIY